MSIEHMPTLVYACPNHCGEPVAEVCWGCSTPAVSAWVAVTFCIRARAAAQRRRDAGLALPTYHDESGDACRCRFDDADESWERMQDEGRFPSWL